MTSDLTCGLSQAEKKITVDTSRATDKMTTIFTQNNNLTILSKIDAILYICSVCNNIYLSSQLEKSNMLNGTTLEIQHRKQSKKIKDIHKLCIAGCSRMALNSPLHQSCNLHCSIHPDTGHFQFSKDLRCCNLQYFLEITQFHS